MKSFNAIFTGTLMLRQVTMVTLLTCGLCFVASAQVRVPFEIRTPSSNPLQRIYSINGDYSFIGNTNLTLVNYGLTTNNNNNAMQYVDVDNDPNTWNSSSADLLFSNENNAAASCSKIKFAGLYWTGRCTSDGAASSPMEFSINKNINGTSVTKNFNKKRISLKGPGATNYETLVANDANIYYPNSSDSFIYSAYTEVTDYVKEHGVGTYWAADLALVEGNGSSTGFSGGWGLVVVYENPEMNHRDITIFDGHAFVLNSNSNGFDLEVNGFHTLPIGRVNAKLSYMASEGDVDLTGDYFQIRRNSDLSFVNLHHALNHSDNFFNSTNTTQTRNPALQNNTGIDIGTFSIPNVNNEVIGNNQTSTYFRYGTVGDTYAIFALVLAVDSYMPKVENTISVTAINAIPFQANTAASPGQIIDINIAIRNTENEAINDFKVVVPMPFNANFVAGSAQGFIGHSNATSNNSSLFFDSNLGRYGSLIWHYGTLPIGQNSSSVIANLKFQIKVTEDCHLLRNIECSPAILVDGFSSGTGSISSVSFDAVPFILGKTTGGNCDGNDIAGPLRIAVNGTQYAQLHCQDEQVLNLFFCDERNSIEVADLISQFPPNVVFVDSFPIHSNTQFYALGESLPLQEGGSVSYYALGETLGQDCRFPFFLSKCARIVANSDNGQVINSIQGGIAFQNIIGNDTLNGQQVQPNEIQLNIISTPVEGVTVEGGNVVVAPGTPAGNYTLTYQICASHDLTLCAQANVYFSVTAVQIVATDDYYRIECSSTNMVGNILINDYVNGIHCTTNEVAISLITNPSYGIQLDTQTGNLTVPNSLAPGNYQFQYQTTVVDSPLNFDIATVKLEVIDETPPAQPQLLDLVDFCSVTVPIPTTTDSCSGEVTGYTDDSLFYENPGTYIVHWVFRDNDENTTLVEQTVIVKNNEDAIPGYGYVDCNLDNDLSLNINLNNFLPEGTNENGTWTSLTPTSNLNGAIFSPYMAPTGSYEFRYLYAQDDCNQSSSVTIEVNNDCFVAPACNLLVHNSFSPNNDGINETFFIENIDQINCFPTNTVEIYNRWGVLVYKTKQYDNITRVFRGISEGRATINESNQLPTGTYFYTIKYTDSKGKEFEESGYLYLVL